MTRRSVPKLLLVASIALFSFGCRSSQPGLVALTYSSAGQTNAPLLPDSQMTPGATLPVTRDDICVPGYTKKVRNVPIDVKRQVYAEYGIASHKPGEYEVDHLISLELGGSNSVKNLWPQSYLTQPWNAHVKDQLENEMHDEVCSGQLDLATAQHDISTDWIAAYKKYFHTDRPLSQAGGYSSVRHHRGGRHRQFDGSSAPPSFAPAGQVWVNLKSGKYFGPNSPYYGHTKQGQFMSEKDAQNKGYIAAKGQ